MRLAADLTALPGVEIERELPADPEGDDGSRVPGETVVYWHYTGPDPINLDEGRGEQGRRMN